jgi:hypothetical protein
MQQELYVICFLIVYYAFAFSGALLCRWVAVHAEPPKKIPQNKWEKRMMQLPIEYGILDIVVML